MQKTESARKTAPARSTKTTGKTPAKAASAPAKAKSPNKNTAPAATDTALPLGVGSGISEDISRQGIRLSFLVHDVSRLRRAAYDQLMKPLNITRARWWVLAHLSRHDGMMQSQLADVLEVGKASLGTVIEQLEASGWVERRSDPKDKRAKRVFLSRTAQPLMKRMIVEEELFNERVLAKVSLDDRATLIRLLGLIKEELSQLVSVKNSGPDED